MQKGLRFVEKNNASLRKKKAEDYADEAAKAIALRVQAGVLMHNRKCTTRILWNRLEFSGDAKGKLDHSAIIETHIHSECVAKCVAKPALYDISGSEQSLEKS